MRPIQQLVLWCKNKHMPFSDLLMIRSFQALTIKQASVVYDKLLNLRNADFSH